MLNCYTIICNLCNLFTFQQNHLTDSENYYEFIKNKLNINNTSVNNFDNRQHYLKKLNNTENIDNILEYILDKKYESFISKERCPTIIRNQFIQYYKDLQYIDYNVFKESCLKPKIVFDYIKSKQNNDIDNNKTNLLK